MSSPPDQNAALQAMFQAGNAMAQGFNQFLAEQHKKLSATPGGTNATSWNAESEELKALQQEWMGRHAQLWQGMLGKAPGQPAPQVASPDAGDKRFDHPAWSESPVYDYLRQAYLINAEYMKRVAEAAPVPDGQTKKRMRFLTRQMVDAMAPSNFLATNPEFVKTALDTKGESIQQGIQNLLGDLDKGRISMTDDSAFEESSLLKHQLERVEAQLLRASMARHKGNKTHVADELGLTRVGLRMKLMRLGLSDDTPP